jgi:hypothetical protein
MKREEHEAECVQKLGRPFTEVHEYLDQFFKDHGPRHRCKLHHKWGIELVRRQFGEDAAQAATLHILSDLALEGFPRDEELIPKDEAEYKKIGLF